MFLRDRGTSEVGGFGVARPDDLLFVEDVQTVEQVCDVASVQFDDAAVAQFFDEQVDAGRKPAQFGRIWIHTHPEISAQPSGTDEETFARVFARSDWAVMFIISRTEDIYCRLRFNAGPGGDLQIPVNVAYGQPFAGSDFAAWEAEYQAHVRTDFERFQDRPTNDLFQRVVDLKPGQATEAVAQRIARAGRLLAGRGWTQESITEAVRSGRQSIGQLVELAEQPASPLSTGPDTRLLEELTRVWGWSLEDIDQQMELGWTLEELVDSCQGESDPDCRGGFADEPHKEALFPS